MYQRHFLIARCRDNGTIELIEEHATNLSGETEILFALFGNEAIWTREMVETQYEVLERIRADQFFQRLGRP